MSPHTHRRSAWLPALVLVLSPWRAQAAGINFTGLLDFVDLDTGGAAYAGTATGTRFTGAIDDVTFNGFITDGATRTDFGCCIAAGGIEIADNQAVDQATADRLNSWLGPGFFAPGHSIDVLNIEGDLRTTGGGRIEVGLSYILHPDAFPNSNPGNYPFDPADLYLTLFFILEENSLATNTYDAIGRVDAVPLPPTVWLLLTGVLAGFGYSRRRRP
jgi:hypothetical protein